ncbi:serine/threonine-protein kinase Nek9-like isoform X2 [Gigantopelta aegis]|uniref:serine/threonine-protein kinase Nek9-like isoform X2 n=1 Tax=Gigantopelta aegis TaxID=1735272 RepID=UPI001B88B7D1|nr:serine/threonine-protein kinase Nek9-like isoform X2 [Gigantopelta aegis]
MAADVTELDGLHETSYVFVRVLGRGAFGEAVLYRKTEDNSLVVWKEINLARLSERQRRDSQNEIDVLSFLNHANVVSYYNHFIEEDTLFIEMEYANGGTLYTKISHQTKFFSEDVVLWYLFQLASALAHIHQYGIIHRDIKTLNIFLTKMDLLKLGDFGISKILETGAQAQSIVGTPYYMSPELMKGETYDFMCDIWALGCVLYELLTLTRTFQGSNPLKLAYDIVLTDHKGIDSSQYSTAISSLLNDMLKKNPPERPTAEDVLKNPLFTNSKELEERVWRLNSHARRARQSAISVCDSVPVVESKMCEVYQWGGGKRTPQKLEMFTREKSPIQVAAGHSHFAAITFEKELFTWANVHGDTAIVGQLGHGDVASYKAPKRVDALLENSVEQVSCGEDFTLCVTDEGAVFAFGSNYYGCLGCRNEGQEEKLSPIPVNFFADIPVREVSCGDAHVVALTKRGHVYTWGCGEFGRLGLNSEESFNFPQKVAIPGKHEVKHVCAASDGSFLVSANGRLLACGSNEHNKLGFNSKTSGLRKRKAQTYDIPCKYTFTTVKPLSQYNIVSVAAGKTHAAVVDLYGYLFTFGSNKHGQLGQGDFRRHEAASRVGGVLTGQRVEKVACGDGFTVISTTENQIYSFGNGESGRLGAVFEQGKGPNGQCTARPRAIFGSLHLVASISCRHWNTLLIAEKILNQKTLKTRVSSPKFVSLPVVESVSEEDSAFIMDGGLSSDTSSGPIRNEPFDFVCQSDMADSGVPYTPPLSAPQAHLNETEESMPSWLQEELQNAEVIPITPGDSTHSGGKASVHVAVQEEASVNESEIQLERLPVDEPEDPQTIISELQAKIRHLEEENKKLWNLVSSQQEKINSLQQNK